LPLGIAGVVSYLNILTLIATTLQINHRYLSSSFQYKRLAALDNYQKEDSKLTSHSLIVWLCNQTDLLPGSP
jgi:hypothetical protein